MSEPETTRLPAAWRPNAGETLAGFISERHSRPSAYSDDDVTILVIDQLDKSVSIWCSTKQLRQMVEENDLQSGDFVELRYDGQEWVKYTNSYRKTYTYRVTKAS